jgi:predicted metalloprotease with PDZ domain
MQRALICLGFLIALATFAGSGMADIPPPYDPYGVGARLEEATPFPKLNAVQPGSPAAQAGIKNGDAVIAIDGDYSAAGRVPFYFFARGMQGPQNSVVELVILSDNQSVRTVKLRRTVPLKSNW